MNEDYRGTGMKTIVVATMCLGGALAMAQDDAGQSEEVIEDLQIRLAGMEQIIVTAEKAPVATGEDVDEDIDAILSEAEALEDESQAP